MSNDSQFNVHTFTRIYRPIVFMSKDSLLKGHTFICIYGQIVHVSKDSLPHSPADS